MRRLTGQKPFKDRPADDQLKLISAPRDWTTRRAVQCGMRGNEVLARTSGSGHLPRDYPLLTMSVPDLYQVDSIRCSNASARSRKKSVFNTFYLVPQAVDTDLCLWAICE